MKNRESGMLSPKLRSRKRSSFVPRYLAFGLAALVPALILPVLPGDVSQRKVQNGGFEASTPGESWLIDPEEAKQKFSLNVDRTDVKEGQQSLLITATQPVNLTLRQEVFLPIGTLWRLTG